jgi:precorrin-6B methylase 2
VRKLLALITPAPLKRWHGRLRERRFDAAAGPVRAAYLARHGTVVRHGPFAGLECVERSAAVAKLVGSYELEIHDAVHDLVAQQPAFVVNIGCGDGYFACGLARLLPDAEIKAFDTDPPTQALCVEQVALNGLTDRVAVAGECTTAMLAAMPADGGAAFLDCEGAEVDLLDPAVAEPLRHWPILVELHDFNVAGATDTIVARFQPTHEVQIIDARDRAGFDVPELADLSAADRAIALEEFRPPGMRWAYMVPRA